MSDLTDTQIACLKAAPFKGFAGGSNIWPLTELEINDVHICDGEDIEFLLRRGLLVAVPLAESFVSEKGAGDIPDIEITHRLHLSDIGSAELANHLTSKESPE